MTADEVKARVRCRYPASRGPMPGPWTVLEEWANIDILAFCAWSHAPPAQRGSGSHPVVGHEVKVTRGDYRRELLRPDKRVRAVARCNEFYFVTPKGLLTDDEKGYAEPEYFEGQAFEREKCPAKCRKPDRWTREKGHRAAGKSVKVPVAYGDRACWISDVPYRAEVGAEYEIDEYRRASENFDHVWVACETCEGRGYMRKAIVELEAPTLWIPRDVGLIEIDGRGCSVVRKAPANEDPDQRWGLGQLIRWVSMRPDPRHHPSRVQAAA